MPISVYDIILRKRNGLSLSDSDYRFLIDGYLKGEIPEYQMSAFLMAVYFRGMEDEELGEFTEIMVNSGKKADLSFLSSKTVDKHSTGGVGDGVSLTLAPLVASFDVAVPMMSGRGLGHTGGTLDKLESIPGYRISLSPEEFVRQLEKIGVAIVGQTEDIAPADKKLYALRDVTATVDSIPLIAASIMSKKLAEGSDALMLDVKTGTGAFMETMAEAEELAGRMIEIGRYHGRDMAAVISDMNQPLGRAVGNAVEIKQAIELMSGHGPADIKELIVELSAGMLVMSGITDNIEEGRAKAAENLGNGKAMEKFSRLVSMQGGDAGVCENPDKVLASASNRTEVRAPEAGYISAMDTRRIGMIALSLGAGRKRVEDRVDFSAGIEVFRKIGDYIEKGDVIAELFSSKTDDFDEAVSGYIEALTFSEEKVEPLQLIYKSL